VITHRHHPWVLLTASAIPAAALLSLAILGTWQLLGRTIGVPAPLPLDGLVCSAELLLAVPFVIWLYYRLEDWRNDIYQVTDDSIFDIERRRSGARIAARRSTSCSMQVVRPNPIRSSSTGNLAFDRQTGQFTRLGRRSTSVQQDIWQVRRAADPPEGRPAAAPARGDTGGSASTTGVGGASARRLTWRAKRRAVAARRLRSLV
jgi:hypothetical protein